MTKETLRISGIRKTMPVIKGVWSFEQRPGGWIVASRPRADGSHERRRISIWEARGRVAFSLGGSLGMGEIIEERSGVSAGAGGSDADLIAQFPGKVRKLLVKPGQEVKAGEPMLLVEAMKMEFAIKAPYDAKVSKIHVAEGQQLMPGDRFVDLEGKA